MFYKRGNVNLTIPDIIVGIYSVLNNMLKNKPSGTKYWNKNIHSFGILQWKIDAGLFPELGRFGSDVVRVGVSTTGGSAYGGESDQG